MTGEILQPAIRASDAERDATITHLRQAAGEGRLALEEYAERTELALVAQTRANLAALTSDLPAGQIWDPAAPPRREVAVLGSVTVKGRWRLGHRASVLAVMGTVNIDLRQAMIDAPVIDIEVAAYMGSVNLFVPEGVQVEVGGSMIMGSRSLKVGPSAPGAPLVRVRSRIFMGGLVVRSGKSLGERLAERLGLAGPN
jgi:hypothetical protein